MTPIPGNSILWEELTGNKSGFQLKIEANGPTEVKYNEN